MCPERRILGIVPGLDKAISGRAKVAGACVMPWQAGSVGAQPVGQGVRSVINGWMGVVRGAATLF